MLAEVDRWPVVDCRADMQEMSKFHHVFALCKEVHSLMPDLGHLMGNGRLVRSRSGFHQRCERTRWNEGIGLGWNEPRRD